MLEKTMLKLELVLQTPMKMEREELRRQKMVGNTKKRGLSSRRAEESEGTE